MTTLDLHPAASRMAALVANVPDDALGGPGQEASRAGLFGPSWSSR